MVTLLAVFLSHKIRLYPNDKQVSYLKRACGIKRFAYNWALAESRKLYEQGIKTSGYDLSKRFNAIKREQFPFVLEVSKWVSQKAIYDLEDAYKNWWSKRARAPKFKKKGKCKDSFYLANDATKTVEHRIYISKCGWVRMSQSLRFPGHVMSVVISSEYAKWHASIQVELDGTWSCPHTCKTQAVCGLDMGVRDLVVLDDGTKYLAPRSLRKSEKKLKRLNRVVSRRVKGSNRRKKAVHILSRVHEKVTNIRKDCIHKITAKLVEDYRIIGMEDLNVKGMIKNHHLAKSVSDAAFGTVKSQLEYKTELSGSVLVKADRFYPSSKMCSNCGHVLDTLPLRIRVWTCPGCGAVHDRDVNAAKNLLNVALRYKETVNARGVESSGTGDFTSTKLSTVKRVPGSRRPTVVSVQVRGS
ncbi:MAG: RNA-guided endonuclease TnpB family protein [Candidatus Paceibacterota bacterium]